MKKQFTLTKPRFGLIGHRGVSSLAPENTLAGFSTAKKLGLTWIEFDLQLTNDQRWVIFHDDTLERTSNGKGAIHEHTFEAIQSLDAGSWFHPSFDKEGIPAFEAVITWLNTSGLAPNLEIKIAPNSPFSPAHYAENLITTLITYWPKHKALPLISSFEHAALYWIREHAPEYPLGFLFETLTANLAANISKLENSSIHFHADTQTDLDLVKKLSCMHPLIPYTINDLTLGRQLLNAGCFALFTDYPQKFIASAI